MVLPAEAAGVPAGAGAGCVVLPAGAGRDDSPEADSGESSEADPGKSSDSLEDVELFDDAPGVGPFAADPDDAVDAPGASPWLW